MKTLIAVAVLALVSACANPAPVADTARNYVGSYEKGGCNSGIECPHAPRTDEGRGGADGGSQ